MNEMQRFTIPLMSLLVSATALHANAANAFSYSFTQSFESGSAVLSGAFSGSDVNGNGRIDASEFTAFTSAFESSEPGFESLSWGLENLAPFSYFLADSNYSLWVTAPASFPNGNGWRSNSTLDETVVGLTGVDDGPIAGRFFAQNPLEFTATAAGVPEPTTIAGILLAGGGLTALRYRRTQR